MNNTKDHKFTSKMTPKTIEQRAKSSVQKIQPYVVNMRSNNAEDIYMDANENPNPMTYSLQNKTYNRYPESQPKALIQNYAHYLGVACENILVTLGGDQSIELLIRTFCEPKEDKILLMSPTFGMYHISAELMDIGVIDVPLQKDQTKKTFLMDLQGVKERLAEAKLIFICSPNNPTGNGFSQAEIIEILELTKAHSIVVVDEAYNEFSTEVSVVSLMAQYPHLAIIRTLSKAFGLAGIRCGFTVASAEIISLLQRVISPYPLPVPVIDIAIEATTPKNILMMRERVKKIIEQREILKSALMKLPIINTIYKSEANWCLVECEQSDDVVNYLAQQSIYIRSQKSQPSLRNALRISVGTEAENRRLVYALEAYVKSRHK